MYQPALGSTYKRRSYAAGRGRHQYHSRLARARLAGHDTRLCGGRSGDEGESSGSMRRPATRKRKIVAQGSEHPRLPEGTVTQLSRDKYVAFNSALRQPGGQASVGHNISAEDTYPKKCRIRHFLGFTLHGVDWRMLWRRA